MTKPVETFAASAPAGPSMPRRGGEQVWVGRVLCFSACVLAVNALIGERGLSETFRARREFRQAVSDLSRIQYENAALNQTIERLRHDARTIEGVARAELGLIRPGEILVSVKEQPKAAATAATTPTR